MSGKCNAQMPRVTRQEISKCDAQMSLSVHPFAQVCCQIVAQVLYCLPSISGGVHQDCLLVSDSNGLALQDCMLAFISSKIMKDFLESALKIGAVSSAETSLEEDRIDTMVTSFPGDSSDTK